MSESLKPPGRRYALNDECRKLAVSMYLNQPAMSVEDIASLFGINSRTLYRYLSRELGPNYNRVPTFQRPTPSRDDPKLLKDDGCEVAPKCVVCPLERCRFDPGGIKVFNRALRERGLVKTRTDLRNM